MAWMKVDQFLPTHGKTARLARKLGWTTRHTCGFLLELWGWAIDHQPDGYIERTDTASLARALQMRRELLARVLTAMRETGWIDAVGVTEGSFHEWHDWGGKIVAQREDDKARQRRKRDLDANRDSSRVTSDGNHVGQRTPPATPPGQIGPEVAAVVTRDHRTQTREDQTRKEKTTRTTWGAADKSDQRASLKQQATVETASEIVTAASEPWRGALGLLLDTAIKTQHVGAFVSWYDRTRLERHGETHYVVAPNEFARDWVRTRLLPEIRAALSAATGEVYVDLRVVVAAELPTASIAASGSADGGGPGSADGGHR